MQTSSFIRRGERGQSFTELAISLTFLLFLLSAAADLGTALYTMIAMRDVAQEASVYGAICPDKPDQVRNRLVKSATAPLNMADIAPSDIQISVVDPSTGQVVPIDLGMSVKVSITFHHRIVTPFIGAVIGRQEYPLTVTVLNTIMRTKCYDE